MFCGKVGRLLKIVIFLFLFAMYNSPVQAGKIVVANDDWTLSDSGFFAPNDPGVFAQNIASVFTGGTNGDFLAYSSHFGLTGANLQSAMTSAGHSWTVNQGATFDLATLSQYDGVFFSADAVDHNILSQYVNAGGNVFIYGAGNDHEDAALWNNFLGNYGLGFKELGNGIYETVEINSSHPLFNGVDHLFQVNGTSILDLDPLDPRNQVLVTYKNEGLYAIYDPNSVTPEPASMFLFGIGGLAMAALKRKKKLI
jgi:hypothetical protein